MKYQKDGRVFEIAKITRDFVVLQALDDSTQVLTGKASLDYLFTEVPQSRGREIPMLAAATGPLLASMKSLEAIR